ncbi:acetyl-CoA carboxylase carboxyl transferase subunit beta [candidate division WOR-3 bacterium]|uniref:Acetyl-coenzyme A carboxylase carboxyl transferase subunit beta n=1 Tax=candidate division WOR-3 bacterium TaxID=2052148 RepID=A0A660SGE5_UNCW3|nr:MAG: acetyl-CoA carboxylase carboxyl transferase subunit beta [candidate division WOR-3 bacterium]
MFFRRGKKPKEKPEAKIIIPDGLWLKCESCGEILYKKELERNLWTCAKCNFHFRIPARRYIALLLDEGKLDEFPLALKTRNVLGFPRYSEKLKEAQQKSKLEEGVIAGRARLGGETVVFVATDFGFMGGSMGSVVGEMVAHSIRHARKEEIPLVILTASGGGARMQEGIFSLMQMAKTSAELALLAQASIPYITVLTHPTMAGVMASFASLGDIIIAEPGALLGFTGPRVIEQTIGQKLPPGFQRSEFLLEHGLIDMVVHRRDLRSTLIRILKILMIKK